MNLNERNIFLLDGVGALASTLFTGLILPFLFQWTGLSPSFLYYLAVIPFLYSLYSFACYKLVKVIRPHMLKAIMIANLVYSLISIMTILNFPTITLWGRLLLSLETVIIWGVVVLEVKVYRKVFNQHVL